MKKQSNSTIKAHLLRGAFLLLLLLAVCMIPFARGQRNTGKRNIAAQASRFSNVNGTVPVAAKLNRMAPVGTASPGRSDMPTHNYGINKPGDRRGKLDLVQ